MHELSADQKYARAAHFLAQGLLRLPSAALVRYLVARCGEGSAHIEAHRQGILGILLEHSYARAYTAEEAAGYAQLQAWMIGGEATLEDLFVIRCAEEAQVRVFFQPEPASEPSGGQNEVTAAWDEMIATLIDALTKPFMESFPVISARGVLALSVLVRSELDCGHHLHPSRNLTKPESSPGYSGISSTARRSARGSVFEVYLLTLDDSILTSFLPIVTYFAAK
ncbi:hypothetical protein C8R46DRAFT_1024432 [Mycena filopes]|nr:hypothetical protein C8R46DRAFT_1024432 [Mycena filopes]